jgi:hypothetical protein
MKRLAEFQSERSAFFHSRKHSQVMESRTTAEVTTSVTSTTEDA